MAERDAMVERDAMAGRCVSTKIIVHHGESGWQAAPALASMLDADAALLEATRRYVPHFEFLLDDLSAVTVEAISARRMPELARLALLALWASRSLHRLERAAPAMERIARAVARDERARALLLQLYAYLLKTAPGDVAARSIEVILLKVAGPEGAEDVMNAGEELIERGRVEGEAKGEAKGLRKAVVLILSTRGIGLSEAGRARLDAMRDPTELMACLDRAQTARSEAELFDNR